jgi:hypothetical protein
MARASAVSTSSSTTISPPGFQAVSAINATVKAAAVGHCQRIAAPLRPALWALKYSRTTAPSTNTRATTSQLQSCPKTIG